jgi:hypothetical protein
MLLEDGVSHLLEMRVFCPNEDKTTIYLKIRKAREDMAHWYVRSYPLGLGDLEESFADYREWDQTSPPP